MLFLGTWPEAMLSAIAAVLLFGSMAAAQTPATVKLEWAKPSLVGVPPARYGAGMVYDRAMGTTLLFGGATYTTTYADTWAFSKSTGWTELTPGVSPSAVAGPSLAYDATTETVVLFGGGMPSGSHSDQTWTWDGVTWTQQFPSVSPPACYWNATNGMVFDSHLGKVVLFGCWPSNETWEWDGNSKTWTQQFPAHSPSARTATLAYDENTNQVILFGGNIPGVAYNDTWTYDGVDWVQQQPATVPPTRTDNGLAYDPVLKKVVLFGGLAGSCEDCGNGRLNDTWLWDGSNWKQVQTLLSPEPSSGVSFTYEGSTKGMLLFGGWVSDFSFTSNTWVFGLYEGAAR